MTIDHVSFICYCIEWLWLFQILEDVKSIFYDIFLSWETEQKEELLVLNRTLIDFCLEQKQKKWSLVCVWCYEFVVGENAILCSLCVFKCKQYTERKKTLSQYTTSHSSIHRNMCEEINFIVRICLIKSW